MTKKTSVATGEQWEYFFDHANKLTKVEHRPNATSPVDKRVEYGYDVFGNRIRRAVDADGDGAGSPVTEKFTYEAIDGEIGSVGDLDISQWNAWADLDANGSLTTRRLYQNAVDAVMARIDSSGTAAWYLTDNILSVRDIVDPSGTLQNHIDYDAFGQILTETSPAVGDRYKYTSREWDQELALQYNRARWYDPEARRWISQDPLGFDAGDGNLYRYVKNRPTVATDASGLWSDNNPFFEYYKLREKQWKAVQARGRFGILGRITNTHRRAFLGRGRIRENALRELQQQWNAAREIEKLLPGPTQAELGRMFWLEVKLNRFLDTTFVDTKNGSLPLKRNVSLRKGANDVYGWAPGESVEKFQKRMYQSQPNEFGLPEVWRLRPGVDRTRLTSKEFFFDRRRGGFVGKTLKGGHPVVIYVRKDATGRSLGYNCHCFTFLQGGLDGYLEDGVDAILREYFTQVSIFDVREGDVVVYRGRTGLPVHSAPVTKVTR